MWQKVWKSEALPNADLAKLMSTVSEHDPCYRGVQELIGRHWLESMITAGSMGMDDVTKLRACERMECFRCLKLELDELRARSNKG